MCFPTTCPQEGSTYVLTARGAEVVDSTLHLDLIERGIARRRNQQQDFILSDIDEIPLTNQERVFFEQKQRTAEMRRDLEEMDAQMAKAILATARPVGLVAPSRSPEWAVPVLGGRALPLYSNFIKTNNFQNCETKHKETNMITLLIASLISLAPQDCGIDAPGLCGQIDDSRAGLPTIPPCRPRSSTATAPGWTAYPTAPSAGPLMGRPYTPDMTSAPLTEAYIERMKRRDDPNDPSVCEHNVDVWQETCRECKK